VVPVPTGGCEDRRCVSSHVETIGGAIAVQPIVPCFTVTGELGSSATGSSATGSTWTAVRTLDGERVVLKIIAVSDVTEAQTYVAELRAMLRRIGNEHVARQHDAIGLADGTLALVLDQVTGGSLTQVLGARGQLSPGETVTTVAPLFGALADLHAAGVVHGELVPANVVFSADGRPMVSDLGLARLLGRQPGMVDGTSDFVAPELLAGAAPSPASDVYAMAAIGWLCLTGAPPEATRPSVTTVRPETPPRLVEVFTSCLSTDPALRPSAGSAAVEVFDAAPAEAVVLATASDPAAEITRRIRAAAVSAPTLVPPSALKRHSLPLVIGVVALLVALALAGGATWFLRRTPVVVAPVAVRSLAQASARPSPGTSSTATSSPATSPAAAPATAVTPAATPPPFTDVVTSPDSPGIAPAPLLQALVDARALAYLARNTALLDLVYATGAPKAGVDRANIDTALKNGATYLGLAFVVKDVAFLAGTSDTARIRATIVTPAYQTGQPDGRKVPHAQEIVGPSVFTLRLAPDGWRILSLTVS
jgi:serine/threonine protein kinase